MIHYKQHPVLDMALQAWRQGAHLRSRRERYKRYTYGRQWDDVVDAPDGRRVTEAKLACEAGRRPLTNNMIRQLVKCITGNFRSRLAADSSSGERPAVVEVPRDVARRNLLDELDCRMLEELLISGCAVQRVVTEHRMSGSGVWVDNVSPSRFFVNKFTDPRGLDIELVGMLHDWSLREVIMRFGSGSPAQARAISAIYKRIAASPPSALGDADTATFFDAEPGRCRVIEVWTLESRNIVKCHDSLSARYFITDAAGARVVRRVNASRLRRGLEPVRTDLRTTVRWHCRMMAPTGDILDEFDSPYLHGMHPFAVKFYPLTDGEVHSFVEDIIDQQRYINRLITLIDHIMSVSAKGVLLFPMDKKPDCYSWDEIGQLWADCNGVIPYDSTGSPGEPHQVISGGEHSGAYHLLDIQMQLFQQISGVSGALQGRLDSGNASASLYDAQVRHSAVAILDLIDTFNAFRSNRNSLINSC